MRSRKEVKTHELEINALRVAVAVLRLDNIHDVVLRRLKNCFSRGSTTTKSSPFTSDILESSHFWLSMPVCSRVRHWRYGEG
jgi:hypothetical protein